LTNLSGAQGGSADQAGHNPCGRRLFYAFVRSKSGKQNGNSALLTFSTHSTSGEMPGVGIIGSAGAAAGGAAAAAASIGVNLASTGVKNITSSTAYLAQQSAKQIVDQTNSYFSQQGWIPATPGS
jgi:hypothetical protein